MTKEKERKTEREMRVSFITALHKAERKKKRLETDNARRIKQKTKKTQLG